MIITSPEHSYESKNSLFLAGGITNCPDWQKPIAELLNDRTPLTIFNPRRESWNMDDDANESKKQIVWEHHHLKISEYILFWFPMETLCPITLLELGKYMMTDKKLIVGTHPDYQRRLDVIVQTRLEKPNLKIWSNLDDMVHTFIRDFNIS